MFSTRPIIRVDMAVRVVRFDVNKIPSTRRSHNRLIDDNSRTVDAINRKQIGGDPAVLHQMTAIARNETAFVGPAEPDRQPFVIDDRADPRRDENLNVAAKLVSERTSRQLERLHQRGIDHDQTVAVCELAQLEMTRLIDFVVVPAQNHVVSHARIIPHPGRVSPADDLNRSTTAILHGVNNNDSARYLLLSQYQPLPDLWYNPGMAITHLALPVTGIRGTIAGVVFSANKSGTYAKGWVKGTNPMSIGQMWQRAQMAQAGALWRTLSTPQQNDWDTFAETPPEDDYNSLGNPYLLSGFGWFVRILLRRRRTGQADDLLAPASTPTAAPGSFNMVLYPATGGNIDAKFTYGSGDFATYYAILRLSIAPGVGTNVQTSRYLNLWEALGANPTTTYFGVNYFDSFGVTQVEMRFFGRLYRQSPSGIRSVPLEIFTDVIAKP